MSIEERISQTTAFKVPIIRIGVSKKRLKNFKIIAGQQYQINKTILFEINTPSSLKKTFKFMGSQFGNQNSAYTFENTQTASYSASIGLAENVLKKSTVYSLTFCATITPDMQTTRWQELLLFGRIFEKKWSTYSNLQIKREDIIFKNIIFPFF